MKMLVETDTHIHTTVSDCCEDLQMTAENILRGAGTCFAPGTARDPLRHAGLRRDQVYR